VIASGLALRLFWEENEIYLRNSLMLRNLDKKIKPSFDRGLPLYHASCFGVVDICQDILARGVEVNAQGGYYGKALQAAAYMGHEGIVRLLLEKGADINAQGGSYANAIRIAVVRGDQAFVRLSLDKGAC